MSLHNNIQQAESYPINRREQAGRKGVEGAGGLISRHLGTGAMKEPSFPSGVGITRTCGRDDPICSPTGVPPLRALEKCLVRQRDWILNFISFQLIQIST